MVFSSLLFVFLFLSLNLICYYYTPRQYKNQVLLAFSLIFYAWGGPRYLFLLLGETAISWFCALQIESAGRSHGTRKRWLIIECICLLGLLGIFKYTGFFLGNLRMITGFPENLPNIVLPIGISFYTFQLISYVVDVYRGEVDAQPAYWKLLLYSSLFHQCIAGPIVRYQTVADAIDHRVTKRNDLYLGIRRFSIGLAKKAILANSCASAADTLMPGGLEAIRAQSTAGLWIGMLFYMLQIYLDFSAYSDMAIGMGRMVGFKYDENFNYPYIAVSVQDFWRRWHISLSTFFRDYVYIPLGGSKMGTAIYIRNMAIVWFLTGMWHGASWNYIFWGIYFLAFLLLEKFVLREKLKTLPGAVSHIYTLLVIYFGWVIFKHENLMELGAVLLGLFGIGTSGFIGLEARTVLLNNLFFLIFAMIAVTPLEKNLRSKLYNIGLKNETVFIVYNILDMITPVLMLFLSMLSLIGDSYNPFLYFQF